MAALSLGGALLVGVVFICNVSILSSFDLVSNGAVPEVGFVFWLVMLSLYNVSIGVVPYAIAACTAYANRFSRLVQGMVLANIIGLLILAVTLYIDAFECQQDEYSSMVFEELPLLQLIFLAPIFITLVIRWLMKRYSVL